ncbi:MAG TPA: 1-(5-phosphoribosyl)-5-[(5-phosphoribosylamino)methylideneamino]imidazole-4-carboxamide isomerase [Armatimonadota bacterium]|mgnify:CR=1 FL=1|nr:1-(5-phosphoribosyl)-5-[(5-phosphoribosylamino)methylideneamino]imidazole-4-carboxamide isomerase [Armatimonadota bacterium]HOS43038.1 1-(5-phosphoribosyl)-5-[(5-phosphoribosylamino)methylideneamino]imidazole-4-carboxamide isomerase [Armatimonadota bacterium]
MFIPIPAIDLQGGRCVRLAQGEFDRETVYGDDPVAMALRWQAAGAARLHVVDLDGARDGSPRNHDVIAAIAATLRIPVQVGGGIRDAETVEKLLFLGVDRCILGTRAAQDRAWAEEVFRAFGERLILGLDAKDGRVAIKGWVETTELTAVALALALKAAGARRVIYTDISRDGMLTGPNVEATARLAADTGLAIIASGGMSAMDDLRRLARSPGIEGAIIGRALYTGAIDLADAVREFAG